jgi:Cu/Ag efflux protein CusF
MKKRTLAAIGFAVALAAGAPAAQAQSDEFIAGDVTGVDVAAGKIAIKHGPIPKLGMDTGMTMVFRAGDPAMLTTVKAGDHVRFVPARVNGQYTVTKIEKMK